MSSSSEESFSIDSDVIDIQSLDVENEQTWLQSVHSENEDVDIQKWKSESELKIYVSQDHQRNVNEMLATLENIHSGTHKQIFDSRTYTRPKKKTVRPSLYSVVPSYESDCNNLELMCGTRTITKHSRLLGDDGRHVKINTNTITKSRNDNSNMKEAPLNKLNGAYNLGLDISDDSDFSSSHTHNKPININLSEPAHNLHNTFNKFVISASHRNTSIANMSPPSLVSSIAMEDLGAFNSSNFSRQGSISSNKSFNINDHDELIEIDGKVMQNSISSGMDISILDEKEMSTSLLSHCQDDVSLGFPLSSVTNSIESSLINSATFTAHGRNLMENSLVNSGTFNSILEPIDDKLANGQPKFQLRKSFLKPDPEDNFDKFLVLNSNCNTDDLRGLTSDFSKSRFKYDTYRKNSEKENLNHNKDDSFLMGDGMSDSFLKETGRESLNITYNKLPHVQQRVRTVNRPQMEIDQTILLPNQVLSPHQQNIREVNNSTFTNKGNATFDVPVEKERELPKRNATFRKLTPPSAVNVTTVLIDHQNPVQSKDDEPEIIDSNKECYNNSSQDDQNVELIDFENDKKAMGDDLDKRDIRGASPHNVVPLNMDDLEHLAYEQEQKLYQVISTPISKPMPQNMGSADILFRQNVISPIHNQRGDMMTSSSSSNISDSPTEPNKFGYGASLGSLHRLNASPKRTPNVKRESSAPEIKSATPNSSRMPFSQKLGVNRFRGPIAQNQYDAPEEGLYNSKSVGGSPAKTLNAKPRGLERPLSAAPYKLTGSDNELRIKKPGLSPSKLRQYSSHKELNKIPGSVRPSTAGSLRPSSRLSFYASNPVLCPKPLVRQASYTIVSKEGSNIQSKQGVPGLRPPSNISGPQSTVGGLSYGQPLRAKHSIGVSLPSGNRIAVVPKPENVSPSKTIGIQNNVKSPTGNAPPQRLPRPSGLPRPSSGIPKKLNPSIRTPSTYSVAPRPNDQADCY